MRLRLNARVATARTITTLGCLALLGGTFLTSGCGRNQGGSAAVPTTATSTDVESPTADPSRTPSLPASSIDGLPGTLFYLDENAFSHRPVLRLELGGKRTPLHPELVVSPDGRQAAWGVGDSDLAIGDVGAARPRLRIKHVAWGDGFRPTWSSDGTQILTGIAPSTGEVSSGQATPVIIRVADGKVTPLPSSLRGYLHYRWSGDGRVVVFTTGECVLKYAPIAGGPVRTVPVLGSQDSRVNPTFLRACDVVGVNTDGTRIAVDLHVGDETDGDVYGSLVADTIVDAATGAIHTLPVAGKVLSVAYGPSGDLLVRSEQHGKRTLTLLSPTDAVLATVDEPASVKKLTLLQYTH